ncbi:MAG: hypothetical protein Q9183_000991 [Haloplaca sp. 2 TL-2023]
MNRPGTFQQYVTSQADYVTPIPESLKSEDAALASRGMALRVIGIDAGSKEQLVRDCGAEHFIDIAKHDDESMAKEVINTAGGLGASAVIVVGIPEGEPVPIGNAFPGKLIFKGATIASTAVGNRRDAIEVMDFAARGVVKTVVRCEKMEKLPDDSVGLIYVCRQQVFQEMKEGKLNGRVVIDMQ